jgi:hypothetical protein
MKPYAKEITICGIPGFQVCHEKYKTCKGCEVRARWKKLKVDARTL